MHVHSHFPLRCVGCPSDLELTELSVVAVQSLYYKELQKEINSSDKQIITVLYKHHLILIQHYPIIRRREQARKVGSSNIHDDHYQPLACHMYKIVQILISILSISDTLHHTSHDSHMTPTLLTDIMLVVSVPVLSEQMTEVQPSVSTDGKLLTMAFFLAILLVPRARQVVMTAGRPSGMAATARATAILK